MSEWTLNRREALQGFGVAALGLASVSTARGQTTSLVTVEPRQVVLEPDETATVEVVLQGASGGVEAFSDVRLELDASVASIEGYSLTRGTPLDSSRVLDDGQTLRLSAALLDNTHPGAPEIAIAEATIRANNPGKTTVTVDDGSIAANDGTRYSTLTAPGSVVVGSGGPPLATLELSPSPVEATETVTLDASGSTGSIVEYRWDVDGDGTAETTTTVPTIEYTYPDPGERTVGVEITDTEGRTARSEQSLEVTEFVPQPQAVLDVTPARPVPGESLALDASGSTGSVVEYRWEFDGDDSFDQTTSGPTTTHTYDRPGERQITLQVEDSAGQTDETSIPVVVDSPEEALRAAFDWLPDRPDVGETVTFDASESSGDIVEYRWDFDTGGESFFSEQTSTPTATQSYDEPGEKTVLLQVEDSNGQLARAENSFVVEESDGALSAAVDWTPAEPGVDEQVGFDASGSTGDIAEYRWDFTGDAVVDAVTTTPTTTHSYDDSGTQTVVLEVADGAGQTDQTIGQVTVTGDNGTELSAAVDWTPDSPEAGATVRFDASGSTGDIAEYRWDFDGDGSFEATTTESATTHTYTEGGTRTVVLEVTDGSGQTDRAEGTVDVVGANDQLSAAVEWSPTTPTVGRQVGFDATESTGDIVEYRWDFDGDGSFEATTATPTRAHTYAESGERTVVLEVTDSTDRTAQTAASISVDPAQLPLSVALETPDQSEAGQSVEFDASASTGPVTDYRWDFDGDGTVDRVTTTPTVNTTYERPGPRLVRLTVTGEGGQRASTQGTITVEGDDTTDPGGDNDDTDNESNGNTSNGDGNTSNGDGGTTTGNNSGDSNESNGDGSGPGFGVGSALAGLGGVGYLLKRRLLDDDRE